MGGPAGEGRPRWSQQGDSDSASGLPEDHSVQGWTDLWVSEALATQRWRVCEYFTEAGTPILILVVTDYITQTEEIETLMNTVRKEYSELQNVYENELNMIEVRFTYNPSSFMQ